MENKIKKIKQNDKKIIELIDEKDNLLNQLGNLLIKNNISFPDDENTIRLVNELTLEIKNINSENDKINQYKKRIEIISSEEKNAHRKIKDIKVENEKHYIGIGETVFSIYLERPGELFELHNNLIDLLELNEKILEISNKIENSERKKDTEGFFGKILVSGTETVLESKKKLLENKYVTLYKTLGKNLCDDKYHDSTTDKEIKGIFSAFEANMKVIEDYEIKLDSLNAEKGNFETEIDEKEKKLKAEYEKKPKEIAEDKKAELDGILLSAGTVFYNAMLDEKFDVKIDNSEISESLKKIEENKKECDFLKKEIERLNREIEIDKKYLEIDKLKEHVQEKQDKVKAIKKEIDKMNRTAKKLEKEIEDLSEK